MVGFPSAIPLAAGGVLVKRRELLIVLGGVAVAWPLAGRAQQKAMPVIGALSATGPSPSAPFMAAFRQGLSEAGYVEGQNLAIEYRWADGHYDRLPALAADLVGRKVDLIMANSPPSALDETRRQKKPQSRTKPTAKLSKARRSQKRKR